MKVRVLSTVLDLNMVSISGQKHAIMSNRCCWDWNYIIHASMPPLSWYAYFCILVILQQLSWWLQVKQLFYIILMHNIITVWGLSPCRPVCHMTLYVSSAVRHIVGKSGPSARSGHRMVTFKGYLILFGGFRDNHRQADFFMFFGCFYVIYFLLLFQFHHH